MCIFAFFQASECHERDPDSKTKDPPERKIFTTERKKSAHERKISTHERKISTHERKMISAPEREISTHERKMISAPERKICASITLPSPQERPLQQYQLRYQEQQCQDIDERLESDYDQLEQQRVDFCTYPRGEDPINDIDFREENYHEYVNNLPEEQFELEETGSRYTIEKLPGQLQVIIFILTSFKITCCCCYCFVFFVIQVIRLYDEFELSWVEFVIVIVFVIQVTRLYDKFEHNLLLLLLLFTVIAIQVTRLYDEFQNNWDFFPTPHLVISIEEQWNSCQIFGVSFYKYKLYKSRG